MREAHVSPGDAAWVLKWYAWRDSSRKSSPVSKKKTKGSSAVLEKRSPKKGSINQPEKSLKKGSKGGSKGGAGSCSREPGRIYC